MPMTAEAKRQYDREYRARNAEKRRAYSKQWNAEHPEYWRQRRAESSTYREQERARDRARSQTPERRSAKRTQGQTRRARLYDAFVETVTPQVVFDRDSYICQQCGTSCDPDAAVPAHNAPTVDHIVALANGGEHSYANTQCLCFLCNSRKGDR